MLVYTNKWLMHSNHGTFRSMNVIETHWTAYSTGRRVCRLDGSSIWHIWWTDLAVMVTAVTLAHQCHPSPIC